MWTLIDRFFSLLVFADFQFQRQSIKRELSNHPASFAPSVEVSSRCFDGIFALPQILGLAMVSKSSVTDLAI